MSLNIEQVLEDYFLISIDDKYLQDPIVLLSLSGILQSENGRLKLYIQSITPEFVHQLLMENFQRFTIVAEIIDFDTGDKQQLTAIGSFSQAYHYLSRQFIRLCQVKEQRVLFSRKC